MLQTSSSLTSLSRNFPLISIYILYQLDERERTGVVEAGCEQHVNPHGARVFRPADELRELVILIPWRSYLLFFENGFEYVQVSKVAGDDSGWLHIVTVPMATFSSA